MSPMRRAAIACCRAHREASADELFPDIDAALLGPALEALGIATTLVAWDDPSQRWEDYEAVVISSTWDSVDRPGEYLEWVRMVDRVAPLVNSASIVEATLDKRFLTRLPRAAELIPVTSFVMPGETWSPPSDTFVVKPTISAGGRETAMYLREDLGAAMEHVARLHAQGSGVIVQEYIAAVEGRGEIKHTFIAGQFSHAIRTGPLLRPGAGVLERPWEVSTGADLIEPTDPELSFSVSALAALQSLLQAQPTYARIDVVSRTAEEIVLMEIETIDPSLSLWASADAARQLALAVERSIP